MKYYARFIIILMICLLLNTLASFGLSEIFEVSALKKTISTSTDNHPLQDQDVLFFGNHMYIPVYFLEDTLHIPIQWHEENQLLHIQPSSFKDFEEAQPLVGEKFVYGEILSIDKEAFTLSIEEHYDDQYTYVEPHLWVCPDVIVILQRNDKQMNLSFEDLKIGDVVGMVLTAEGSVRGIILNA